MTNVSDKIILTFLFMIRSKNIKILSFDYKLDLKVLPIPEALAVRNLALPDSLTESTLDNSRLLYSSTAPLHGLRLSSLNSDLDIKSKQQSQCYFGTKSNTGKE